MGEHLAVPLSKACDEVSHRELIGLLAGLATVTRSVPAVEQRALARLIAETEPARLGEASWKKVLTTALRVSGADAAQRLKRAKTLGPRRGLTGQPLAPLWESTAAAQARGVLDAAHIAVIAKFHKKLPSWVDVGTRAEADAQLAELGSGLSPEELRACADRLRSMIDQDGPEPCEQGPAHRRGVRFGPQQPDGYSSFSGGCRPDAEPSWKPSSPRKPHQDRTSPTTTSRRRVTTQRPRATAQQRTTDRRVTRNRHRQPGTTIRSRILADLISAPKLSASTTPCSRSGAGPWNPGNWSGTTDFR